MEPTFDSEGYPTDETIQHIREWKGDFHELMAFVRKVWTYKDAGFWEEHDVKAGDPYVWEVARRQYNISTAGWSGNESLVEALRANTAFWFMCWVQERKGGHYIFEIRKEDEHA